MVIAHGKKDGAVADNMVYVEYSDSKGNWHDVDAYQAVNEKPEPAAAPSMFSLLGAIVDAFNGVDTLDDDE